MRVLPLIASVSSALALSMSAAFAQSAPGNDTQYQSPPPAADPQANQPGYPAYPSSGAPSPGSTSSQETYGAPHSSFGSGDRYSDNDNDEPAGASGRPYYNGSGSAMSNSPERSDEEDVHHEARQVHRDRDYPPAEFGSSGNTPGTSDGNEVNRNPANPGP